MLRKWSRRVTAVAIVAAVGLAGTACAPEAGAPKAEARDSFVYGLGSDPATLNLALTTNADAEAVGSAVYDTLLRIDRDFNLLPGLAESWEASEDSTQFTFQLREGVTWHDGEPFTSADIKFYFDEVLALYPLSAPIAAIYDSTETPDDLTAVVKLTAPFGPFFEAVTANYIIPAHLYSGTDIANNPANLKPVGTGPYVFESYKSGDSVSVTRNEEYWGGLPPVENLVFKVMPDGNARALAIQSGDVDLVTQLPLAQLKGLEGKDAFDTIPWTLPGQMYLFFNTRQPALAEPEVRQAIYRALDREDMVNKVYLPGMAEVTTSAIPNQVSWAVPESIDFTDEFSYDPDAAESVLGSEGLKLRIALHPAIPEWTSVAQLIQADLAEIGVEVELVSQDFSVYSDQVYTNHDFDLAIAQLDAYADPSLGVARAYVCNAEDLKFRNPTGVCDPAIDAAFGAAAATSDRETRADAFADATVAVADVLGTAPMISITGTQVIRADRWGNLDAFTDVHHHDWLALEPAS